MKRTSLPLHRRTLITLLGGAAAAWPLAARAQQPVPVIAYLSARSAQSDRPMLAAFSRGLRENGYIEGQDVLIEYRWGEGDLNRIPAHAAELVQKKVSLIVALGGDAVAQMVRRATATIPIVFLGSGDPVQAGLVASLNRPGGNVTGINMLLFTLTAKQLGLLRELVPASKRVAMLVNPSQPEAQSQIKDGQNAAETVGLELVASPASTESELDAALDAIARQQFDALLVVASPFFVVSAPKVVSYVARLKLPTMYFRRELAEIGGLISYGSSTAEAYLQAAAYAAKILKGTKPADLPIVQSSRFELLINLKTAKALGLEVPPTLLARADEVIE